MKAQIRRGIIHFVSRDAMNIDGLGESIITLLLNEKIIEDIADLYSIKKEDIVNLERMGEKSATNLINSIQKSKENDLWRLINGLGIKFIGVKGAKILANSFKSLDSIIEANVNELVNLEEFGETMANSVVEFFKEGKNINVINKLKEAGLNTKIIENEDNNLVNLEEFGETMANSVVEFFKEGKNINVINKLKEAGLNTKIIENEDNNKVKVFEGMKIVLTGTLPTLKRNDAKEMIESRGGKATSSVSKSTTFVLAGEEAGSKLTKANELGIKVIDENEFIEICKLNSKEEVEYKLK